MAPLASGQTERQRKVRLARARVTQKQHVLPALEKFAPRQLQHLGLVYGRDAQELESVQALDHWEAGLMDATLGGPPRAVQQFQLRHAQQVTRIIHARLRYLPGLLDVL